MASASAPLYCMNLTLIRHTPAVAIYYDSYNNWLFADWQGELTLSAVAVGCLELAQCYLTHTYPRVLNSNAQVTGVGWDVSPWLARYFLPFMSLAGVEQLAWVCGPTLRGRGMAQDIARRLPQLALDVFDDLESAVSWLTNTQFNYATGCALTPRALANQTQLARVTQAFGKKVSRVTTSILALPQAALV